MIVPPYRAVSAYVPDFSPCVSWESASCCPSSPPHFWGLPSLRGSPPPFLGLQKSLVKLLTPLASAALLNLYIFFGRLQCARGFAVDRSIDSTGKSWSCTRYFPVSHESRFVWSFNVPFTAFGERYPRCSILPAGSLSSTHTYAALDYRSKGYLLLTLSR